MGHTVAEITLNRAEQLPQAERAALLHAFRANLEFVLGGPDAVHQALQEAQAQVDGDGAAATSEVEPQGALRQAFVAADYTTWMGRNRPLGAHFGILFDRVTAN